MHICKGCSVTKPAADYRIHKRGYRIGKCRGCERAYQRDWYTRDPDKLRAAKRESMARRRAADPGAARAYAMQHHYRDHEKSKATMRAYAARRFFWVKAMKLRGEGRATTRDLAVIWKRQRGLCALTGRKLDRTAQLDHITAKARGGGDDPRNLRWLCKEANLARRELSDAEFIALCGEVMRWIGERIAQVAEISARAAA